MAKRVKWYPEMYDRYQDAMRIPLDQQLGKQSVFKKPYLYDVPSSLGGDDGFTRMEREGDSHSTSPWRRPAPYNQSESPSGPGLGSNCDPAIIDYGGSYFDCECENDCVIWMKISCSANVKKVIISGQDLSERPVNSPNWRDAYDDGVILHVTARGLSVDTPHPYEIHTLTAGGQINDTLMHPTSKAVQKPKLGTGIQVAQNGVISGIFENDCCKNCENVLTIGYTSQQMSCGGTQTLTATNGGKPPDGKNRYAWTHTGGGSISATTGDSVDYTAPSVGEGNANCENNATITVKDCCGTVATFHIAINCALLTAAATAMGEKRIFQSTGCVGPWYVMCPRTFKCDDSNHSDNCPCATPNDCTWYYCSLCWECTGPPLFCGMYIDGSNDDCVNACSDELLMTVIPYWAGNCIAGIAGQPIDTHVDVRTEAQKAAGCCPASLL